MKSQDLLQDFDTSPPVKSRSYPLLIALLAIYLLYVLVDFFISFETFTIKTGRKEWSVFFLLFGLPLIGTVFFTRQKAGGWFINALFFCSLSLVAIISIFKTVIDDRFGPTWYVLLLLSLVVSSAILLLSPSIRKQLKVSKWMLIIAVAIAIIIALLFLYFVTEIL